MRKTATILALSLALGACGQSGRGTYTIRGTVDGAMDEDSVFICEVTARSLQKIQSAAVRDGAFEFTGSQKEPQVRYLLLDSKSSGQLTTDFFLEEGQIVMTLGKDGIRVTGTVDNDIYQDIKDGGKEIEAQFMALEKTMSDASLTEEEKMRNIEKANRLEEAYNRNSIEGMKRNMDNPVGLYLLKQNYYYLDSEVLEEVCGKIPAKIASSDEQIASIIAQVEKKKQTGVGKMFTDFAMEDPEGHTVHLSDWAGKGKYVLIDFWASWCGPCRQEMPNLKRTYSEFKDKGFEVVGVSLDKDKESWLQGIKDLGISWPQMSDLKYWNSQAAGIYAVSAIPHTVLLDRDGTILARDLRGEALNDKIRELLP